MQRASLFDVNGGSSGDTPLSSGMSSALAAASNGGTKMPDLALAEAAAAAGASPTRSEEDEELNAAAAEAVRNLKSDDEGDDEIVRGENGDSADLERKGLKDEIDAGENKEKQVSQTFSLKSNNSLMHVVSFCGQNDTRHCK